MAWWLRGKGRPKTSQSERKFNTFLSLPFKLSFPLSHSSLKPRPWCGWQRGVEITKIRIYPNLGLTRVNAFRFSSSPLSSLPFIMTDNVTSAEVTSQENLQTTGTKKINHSKGKELKNISHRSSRIFTSRNRHSFTELYCPIGGSIGAFGSKEVCKNIEKI